MDWGPFFAVSDNHLLKPNPQIAYSYVEVSSVVQLNGFF